MSFDKAFIEEQIASLKVQLAENAAGLAKAREAQQYSLDTGQTRQSVMRAQLSQLQNDRKAIMTELQFWQSQLKGGASRYVRPVW